MFTSDLGGFAKKYPQTTFNMLGVVRCIFGNRRHFLSLFQKVFPRVL